MPWQSKGPDYTKGGTESSKKHARVKRAVHLSLSHSLGRGDPAVRPKCFEVYPTGKMLQSIELSFTNKPQSKLLEVESSKAVIRDKDADFESNVQSSYQALEAFMGWPWTLPT